MQSILVTGGAGFIGSCFVRYWANKNPEDNIIVVDSLTYAGNKENLSDVLGQRCSLVEVSINETDAIADILRQNSIRYLVHFAAESHVDRSINGPGLFIDTNVYGTFSLLEAAKRVWLDEPEKIEPHRFHHVSTDEVFGSLSMTDAAFTEASPYAPNSPYSASKASSDFFVRSYHETYGLDVTTSNCSNNYGPYHMPDKLIPLTITNILRGKSIPIYGTGENVRDWLHVSDHVRAIESIVNNSVTGKTYNVGGNNEVNNIDVVTRICTLVDSKFSASPALFDRFKDYKFKVGDQSKTLITYVKDRAGHDFRYAIDASLIKQELGFNPDVTFDKGLEDTIDWYLKEYLWWEPYITS